MLNFVAHRRYIQGTTEVHIFRGVVNIDWPFRGVCWLHLSVPYCTTLSLHRQHCENV